MKLAVKSGSFLIKHESIDLANGMEKEDLVWKGLNDLKKERKN